MEGMCGICGKEPSEMSITGRSYDLGASCYDLAIKYGVNWNADTTLEQLEVKFEEAKRKSSVIGC